jgi:hypothetical protein
MFKTKSKAELEAYQYFNDNIRKFPRDKNGNAVIDKTTARDNDVDAFRHAYVSGVYTQRFGEYVADSLGKANEIKGDLKGQPEAERNMDLWNNKIGRDYGKKILNKEDLLKALEKALKNGELIITTDKDKDSRQFIETLIQLDNLDFDLTKPIIVLQESDTGRNEVFFNILNKEIMNSDEFVAKIEAGEYPGYQIKIINKVQTPVFIADGDKSNNLG